MLIDQIALKNHFDNDVEMIQDMSEIFAQTYPETLNSLKESISQTDFKGIELHAHTLKGMIANFFSMELKEAAFFIEQCGKNNDLSGHESHLEVLSEKLPVMLNEIKQIK